LKKKIKDVLKIVLFFSIGIAIIVWVWFNMKESDKQDFWSALQRANYFWLILAIVLGSLAHLSRAWRWRLIIEPFGYTPKKSNLFFAVMNMYFFNMLVPRLGEITRCASLQQYEKIPFEKTFGTVVVERVIDLLMLILLFGVTSILQLDSIGEIFDSIFRGKEAPDGPVQEPSFFMKNLKLFILGFVVLVAGALFLLRRHPFFGKIFQKMKMMGKGFLEGLRSITKVKSLPEFFAHTGFIWLMYFLMTYVCFFALPETSHVGLLTPLSVLVFGSVAIMFTPNGMGAFPIVVATILQLKDMGGVEYGTGYALGWIIWAGQTVLILLLGLISLILQPIVNKQK